MGTSRLDLVRRRLVRSVLVIAAVVVAGFFLIRIPSGDMVDIIIGEAGGADIEFAARMRAQFGLDQPLWVQFVSYVRNVLSFDLGYSYQHQAPVLKVILERMPITMLLAACVLVVGVGLGTLLGCIAASKVNRWPDTLISGFSLVLYATPNFWFGLMIVLLFSLQLQWFPPFGIRTLGIPKHGFDYVLDLARHLVLPIAALGTHYVAVFVRITRNAMLEVTNMDFVKTARSKGIPQSQVVRRHILRNALLPLVTYTGLQAGNLVGGTVLVETVFAIPGLGRLTYDAILSRDYMMLLGILIVTSVLVILVNLITDILYTFVEPRAEFT